MMLPESAGDEAMASRCPTTCSPAPTRTSAPSIRKSARTAHCGSAIGATRSSATCSIRSAIRTATTSAAASIGWCTRRSKLLEPVTQFDKSEAELLEQLREYEPRTRYRARRELRDRPTEVVVAAVKKWVAALDANDPEYDRLRCEALWVLQSHHAVDEKLLREVLSVENAERPRGGDACRRRRARLSARRVRVARGRRARRASARAAGSDPRPELLPDAGGGERGARGARIADGFVDRLHARAHARGARTGCGATRIKPARWPPATTTAQEFIEHIVAQRRRASLARGAPQKCCSIPKLSDASRDEAYAALEAMHGDAKNGQSVFTPRVRSCHKVGDIGYTFGPELSDVGKRLNRREIIESIIEPSKKVDPKYVTTTIITNDGKTRSASSSRRPTTPSRCSWPRQAERFPRDDIDEMTETKQSSMPENLASTLAPAEFLDVIEYMSKRK